jgi:threonine dehydratase
MKKKKRGVIACSAGNHAQGVALSSHLLKIKSKIVMPTSAPQAKVDATRGYMVLKLFYTVIHLMMQKQNVKRL